MFVCRTRCQWSALQGIDGVSYKTVYHIFKVWSKLRLFEHAFYDLSKEYRRHSHHPIIADSTYVKIVNGCDVLGPNPTDREKLESLPSRRDILEWLAYLSRVTLLMPTIFGAYEASGVRR
jgi:hypothetical protein